MRGAVHQPHQPPLPPQHGRHGQLPAPVDSMQIRMAGARTWLAAMSTIIVATAETWLLTSTKHCFVKSDRRAGSTVAGSMLWMRSPTSPTALINACSDENEVSWSTKDAAAWNHAPQRKRKPTRGTRRRGV